MMKHILTLLAIALATSLSLTSTAEARGYRVGYTSFYTNGYESCGCPIRYKKVVYGFEPCGTPLWRHYRVATRHRCHSRRVHRGYNSHNARYHNNYGRRYFHNSPRYYYRDRYQNSRRTRAVR